jgi:heme exporter protein D
VVKHPPNPIRSEGDAFAFLVWFVAAVAVIAVIVLLVQALA